MAQESAFQVSEEDAKNFLLAILVMTAAFTAFFRDFNLDSILVFGLASVLILGLRELAHRTVAYYMTAYTDLDFTRTGAILTIITAMAAVALDQPLIFLIPVSSEFRNVPYESWGYEIDVVWSKREYWFAAAGMAVVLIAGVTANYLGYERIALATAVFAFYQMLPFRENSIVEGSLDGAYILLNSGFIWLLFVGISILTIALSI